MTGHYLCTFRALMRYKVLNLQLLIWGPAMNWRLIRGGTCPHHVPKRDKVVKKMGQVCKTILHSNYIIYKFFVGANTSHLLASALLYARLWLVCTNWIYVPRIVRSSAALGPVLYAAGSWAAPAAAAFVAGRGAGAGRRVAKSFLEGTSLTTRGHHARLRHRL